MRPYPTLLALAVFLRPLPVDAQTAAPDAVATATLSSTRATLHAVRLRQPLRIDGVLDEGLYQERPPLGTYTQVEPEASAPATERTDTWVAFDDKNVYVSFRAWDSQMDRLVATEMRRDNGTIWSGNDNVVFIFDTFDDRRSSISFTINPLGGRADGQVINEKQFNPDWNPVWELKTGRFDGGWTIEAALPFKSLRYRPGIPQVWGFNAMRVKRSKNEISTLSPVPPSKGQQGVEQPAFAATLLGIEPPPTGRNIEVKPYLTSSVASDRRSASALRNNRDVDVGIDAKYLVTQNLTADVTYKTDFAQVEADQQQTNLTRFSLFFPEKREFFLENQGVFSFGGVAVGSLNAGASDAPILFYSRRIGLAGSQQVPIEGGGRLTGRAGPFSVGILNIQSGRDDAAAARSTNFTVVRLKRDVLRRSSLGLMFTNRSVDALGQGTNRAYGLDGTFAFLENLQINTYWARTDSDRLSVPAGGDETSYRAQLDYTGDRYGVQVERLAIGDAFNPEIGFVRRDDMVRDFAQARFSPRPRRRGAVRKYVYLGSLEYIENMAGRLETRERTGEFAIEFQNADRFSVNYTNSFEFFPVSARIGAVTLPVGSYAFDTLKVGYNLGQQRALSGNLSAEYGTFYTGHKTTLSVARGRAPVTSQLSFEPTYSFNRVDLQEGRFTTHLLGSRVTYAVSPMMFGSALVQYNSDTNTVAINARLRWEYRPGSEIFVVYNEERNTLTRRFPALNERSFIVKINKLLRF